MPVQACCRSLIVDTLSIPLQQAGSAWGTLVPIAICAEDVLTITQLAECALSAS